MLAINRCAQTYLTLTNTSQIGFLRVTVRYYKVYLLTASERWLSAVCMGLKWANIALLVGYDARKYYEAIETFFKLLITEPRYIFSLPNNIGESITMKNFL